MPTHINQSDVTGTINMASPEAVTDAICAILARRYPDFDEAALRQAFADIVAAFWGRYPRLLACDTPYHDLRHSLGTALLMARLVDGYEIAHAGGGLGSEEGSLAVLLALYHDIGFLRRDNEATINGACLIRDHEQRSVDFTREYLAHSRFARFAEQAQLIHATNFARPIAETLHGLPRELFVIGQMLGTADLVSQIAGRYYLERCRDFLYPEFVIAGADRSVNAAGETLVLYATAEDLLRKTPGFYQHLAKPRLDKDFEQVWRYVEPHFGGDNPYARAMQHNLDYLRQLIERDDFSGLRRKPQAMMPAAG
ncbi:MAG TPA: HD domain-containing protein [Rhodocyclaceae bacterium]